MRKATKKFISKIIDGVMQRLENIIVAAVIGGIYALIVGGCNHLNHQALEQQVKLLQENANQ